MWCWEKSTVLACITISKVNVHARSDARSGREEKRKRSERKKWDKRSQKGAHLLVEAQ
jgi:hypothetical protein